MLVCGAWAGFRPSPVGTTVTANRRLHLQASWLSPDRICPQHLFFGQGQPKSPSKLCVFDLVAWLWSLKRHDAVCLARPMWNLMRAILGSSSTNGLKNAIFFDFGVWISHDFVPHGNLFEACDICQRKSSQCVAWQFSNNMFGLCPKPYHSYFKKQLLFSTSI